MKKKALSLNNNTKLILMFAALCLIIIAKRPGIITEPYLWAEDGNVFLQRAMDNGWKAMFMPYAGYFHFIPQLVALISYKIALLINTMIPLPHIMKTAAILFSAFSVWYFCTDDFASVVDDPNFRFLIACCVLAFMSNTAEVWYTITNFQWWGGAFIFLFGIDVVSNRALPKQGYIFITLLCIGLSTTMCGLSLLIVIYAILEKSLAAKKLILERTDIKYLIACVGCVAIQLLAVAKTSNAVGSLDLWGCIINALYCTIAMPSQTILGLFSPWLGGYRWLFLIVGILWWAAVAILAKSNKDRTRIVLFSFLFLLAYWSLITIKSDEIVDVLLCFNVADGRYRNIPNAIAIFITCNAILWLLPKKIKQKSITVFSGVCFAALFVFACILLPQDKSVDQTLFYYNTYNVQAKCFEPRSKYTMTIPLAPDWSNWHVKIPASLRKEYRIEEKNGNIEIAATETTKEKMQFSDVNIIIPSEETGVKETYSNSGIAYLFRDENFYPVKYENGILNGSIPLPNNKTDKNADTFIFLPNDDERSYARFKADLLMPKLDAKFKDDGRTLLINARGITDPNGVESVSFAVWCDVDGQDDLIWYPVTATEDGSYSITVHSSDHKNQIGTYLVHLYYTDGTGNFDFHEGTQVYIAEDNILD